MLSETFCMIVNPGLNVAYICHNCILKKALSDFGAILRIHIFLNLFQCDNNYWFNLKDYV